MTIHIEHRRVQTRSPHRCKKVSPLEELFGKMLSGQSSSSCYSRFGTLTIFSGTQKVWTFLGHPLRK